MATGELLGRARQPHDCDMDFHGGERGDIWQCTCGKRYIYKPSEYGLMWKPISRWRSDRILRKGGFLLQRTATP